MLFRSVSQSRYLSLSVDDEYLALEDNPPMFRQDYTYPALLVASSVPHRSFHVRGYHPLWPPFPERSVKSCAITCRLFQFRSPLLSESRLISLPLATEMVHFTRFAPRRVTYISICWVAPFGNPRIKALLPAPRSLSQAITSFVAYHRQGIHHMLLFT